MSDPVKHPPEPERDGSHNNEAELETEKAEFSFSCRFGKAPSLCSVISLSVSH